MVYLDNVLVYSTAEIHHKEHFTCNLKQLWVEKLYRNREKYAFGVWEVEYLGHLVSHGVVKVESVKTKVVMDWLEPMCIKYIQ